MIKFKNNKPRVQFWWFLYKKECNKIQGLSDSFFLLGLKAYFFKLLTGISLFEECYNLSHYICTVLSLKYAKSKSITIAAWIGDICNLVWQFKTTIIGTNSVRKHCIILSLLFF